MLVSDTAYEQIRNRPEIEVAALESFRLKNVTRPLELYAVSGPDLVVPDRSAVERKGELVVAFRASLPRPSTELLGRDRELDELADLVQGHRVVTITGSGGVGRTRLVTELGHRLEPAFPDGVGFVGFADVTEPGRRAGREGG